MKKINNHGWTLIEIMLSLAIISIIVLALQRGLDLNKKGAAMSKISFDNQSNAKGALYMMSHEIRNCRDLLMPPLTSSKNWPRNLKVNSNFLSFQKYKTKTYSNDFSTVTYSLELDKLYRYEHYGSNISKRMILDNLLPDTRPFYLFLGDVRSTRNIGITLTMKNQIKRSSSAFTTNVFVQNPPAIGDNTYDDLP